MTIDALAFEPHFVDHLAPVWRSLPDRGRFLVAPELMDRATGLGVDAEPTRVNLQLPPAGKPDRRALVASYGDLKKARRLGYGSFAYLEHGIGQAYIGEYRSARHGSYPGGIDHADVGLFLVPNEYAANLWRTAYPNATVAIVGSPKLDSLPQREPGPGPVVAISFHCAFTVSQETQPAFAHFKAALPELAKRYTVIGHAHPRWADTMAREYRRLGIEFVADFADVCRRADVYVCDNSSTIYEFASTGRPVVVLNPPWYRRNLNHGLRFWEAADVGVNVDAPDDLITGVEEALADPAARKAARHDALHLVYPTRGINPSATGRAVSAILEWLGWTREDFPDDTEEAHRLGYRPRATTYWTRPVVAA